MITELPRAAKEWGIVNNFHGISPFLDRVFILIDPEESKYNCRTCKGKGITDEICEHCLGTGREPVKKGRVDEGELCRECIIKGVLDRAYGKKPCPDCKGQGGLISKPDNTKQRQLTGKVLSTGPECRSVRQNMRVMFSNYTGTAFKLDDIEVMFCSEKDLIGEYKQLKKEGNTEGVEEVRYDEPSDVGLVS
jgi:co-chaperonin GroES (HSP10)